MLFSKKSHITLDNRKLKQVYERWKIFQCGIMRRQASAITTRI